MDVVAANFCDAVICIQMSQNLHPTKYDHKYSYMLVFMASTCILHPTKCHHKYSYIEILIISTHIFLAIFISQVTY